MDCWNRTIFTRVNLIFLSFMDAILFGQGTKNKELKVENLRPKVKRNGAGFCTSLRLYECRWHWHIQNLLMD